MTTSVIYGSTIRGQNVQGNAAGVSNGVSAATIYSNLTSFVDTKVTRTQFVNATGSTTNPTAVFGTTPASGAALLAVLARTADNVSSTMPAGWALVAGAGTTGRRIECWWKRAGASEPTSVAMTNATAAAWNMTLIEYGGWATLANPVGGAVTVASSVSIGNTATGMMAGIVGIVAGSSWTTATLTTTTGSNASLTQFAATTQANVSEVVGYNNSEDALTTYTLAVARGTHRLVVGWLHNTAAVSVNTMYAGIDGATTSASAAGQIAVEFDTTPIYALNTVSSATFSGTVGTTASWPATDSVDIYPITLDTAGGALTNISKSATNTRIVWRKPSEITSLTRIATRPGGSTWSSGAYAWTSDTAFVSNINQGGTTRILICTNTQKSGSPPTTAQNAGFSTIAGDHFLTIVHDRLVPITYTITASPIVTRLASLKRTVTYTITASPIVTRLANLKRTVAATVTASPTVARLANLKRTVAATVTASPIVARLANLKRTVAATVTASPIVAQLRVTLRTISATITASPTVSRLAAFYLTVTATITASPIVATVKGFYRTIAATITATGTVLTTYTPFIVQLPRILSLAGRSTIKLVQQSTVASAARSTIKLVQQSTLRLAGRSGIKLPKE